MLDSEYGELPVNTRTYGFLLPESRSNDVENVEHTTFTIHSVCKQTNGCCSNGKAGITSAILNANFFFLGHKHKNKWRIKEKKKKKAMNVWYHLEKSRFRLTAHIHTHTKASREKLTPRCVFDVLGCLISADMLSPFAFNGVIVIVTKKAGRVLLPLPLSVIIILNKLFS